MASAITKRKTDPLPAGTVNVWEALRAAIDDVLPGRPTNSVTPAELAERCGYTTRHASNVLQKMSSGDKATLQSVAFRSGSNRRATCYVPKRAA